MTITMLLFILPFMVMLQHDRNRTLSALIFTVVTISSDLLFWDINQQWYFLACAMSDLLIIALLCALPNPSTLCIRLIYVSLSFIMLQFLGWIIWYMYLPPTFYEILCIMLLLGAIFLLILDNNGDVNDDGYNSVWTRIYRNIVTRNIFHNKSGA